MPQRKLQRTRPLAKPQEDSLVTHNPRSTAPPIIQAGSRSSSKSRAASAQSSQQPQGTHPVQAAQNAQQAAPQRNIRSVNTEDTTRARSAKTAPRSGATSARAGTAKSGKGKKAPVDIADRPAFNLDLGGPPPSTHSRTGLRAPAKSTGSVNVHAYTTKERAELFSRAKQTQNKRSAQSRPLSTRKAPPTGENVYRSKGHTSMDPDVNTSFSEHSFTGRSSSTISHSNPFRSHSEQARTGLSTSELTSSSSSGIRHMRSTSKFKDMSMDHRGMQAAVNAVTDIAYRSGADLSIFGDSSFDNYSAAKKLKTAKTKEEQNKIRQHQLSELIGDMVHYQARIATPADVRSPFTNFGTQKQTAAIKATKDALDKYIDFKKPVNVAQAQVKKDREPARPTSSVKPTAKPTEKLHTKVDITQYPVKCSSCGVFLGMATEPPGRDPTYCSHCAEQVRAKAAAAEAKPQYKLLVSPSTAPKLAVPVSPSIVETMVITQGKTPPHPEPQMSLMPPSTSPIIYNVRTVPKKTVQKQTKIIGTSSNIPFITDVDTSSQGGARQDPLVEKWAPTDTVQHVPKQELYTTVQPVGKEQSKYSNQVDGADVTETYDIVPAFSIVPSKPKGDSSESVSEKAKPITRNVGISHTRAGAYEHKYTREELTRLSNEEIEDLIAQRISELHKSVHHRAQSVDSQTSSAYSLSSSTYCSSASDDDKGSSRRYKHHRHKHRKHKHKHKHRHHNNDQNAQRLAFKDGKPIIIERVKCPCCEDITGVRILDSGPQHHHDCKENNNRGEKRSHHRHRAKGSEGQMMDCIAVLSNQIKEMRSKSAGRLGQSLKESSYERVSDEERRKDRLALLQRLDDRLAGIQAMSGALSLGARCAGMGSHQRQEDHHIRPIYGLNQAAPTLAGPSSNASQPADPVTFGTTVRAAKSASVPGASAYGLDSLFNLETPATCHVGY